MRFLIAIVVLACATGAYCAPEPKPDPAGPAAILPPREPTLSPGDINGAAIELAQEVADAQVQAIDIERAVYDATQQASDHVAEVTRQQIDTADDQAWKTVDNIKTIEARLDGTLAASAPVLAKQYVRQNGIAPVLRPGGLIGDQRYAAPYVAPRFGVAPGAYAPGLLGAGIAPVPTVPTVLPTPGAPIVTRSVDTSSGSEASSSDVSSSVALPDEAPEDILKTSDAKTSSSGSSQGFTSSLSSQGYTSSASGNQGPAPTTQSPAAGAQTYPGQVAANPNPIYNPYTGYNYDYNGIYNPAYVPQAQATPYYQAPYPQIPQIYQNPYYGSPYYNYNQLPYNAYNRFY